ncbi:MAG: trimethylamine methyltransferase family protein [Desulfitobacterium hafniense]|nr:trimethylamine methyltransferase family protein [Desulfitobacterium hafniense]
MTRYLQTEVLTKTSVETLHKASLNLISNVGMKIDGTRSLKLLVSHGAKIKASGLVTIPENLIEWALSVAPKELTLYTRNGEPFITVDSEKSLYYGTHADQLEILDPYTGISRKFLKKDITLMCKIAQQLNNIHFILSVGMCADVPTKSQSQISFIETVKHFSKPINFSTNDVQGLRDVINIAATVSGGLKQLQEKPFIFHYCEPIPPMTHPTESTEKLIISAEHRIPIVYMPYCMMGGTSPMSFAATLAQCNAEVLVGLVIAQLAVEGTPFIYGAMPSVMDMRTTVGSYGAPEFHLLIAAASELARSYGLPFYGTAGCTDAKALDEQAVAEVTMEVFSTSLSRANLVHDVGVMDHCKSVSPELVVLVDEIIEQTKAYMQGVTVESEDLCLDLIEKVGPGGQYLTEMHTLDNFKRIWYPRFFSRQMQQGNNSFVRPRIKQYIADIDARKQSLSVNSAIVNELDSWSKYLLKS